MRKNKAILCMGTLFVAFAGAGLAASIYSATGGITGNWSSTNSWAGKVLPGTNDIAYLRYSDTINADTTIAVNEIRVANSSTLNLNSNAHVTVGGGSGYTYVGYYLTTTGNNNLTLSDGAALNTGRLYLGHNDGGTVTISGGTITASERIFIGNTTNAAVATTQTGGTVTTAAADINMVTNAANGTYALNGGIFQTTKLAYRFKNAGTPAPFTMGGTGILKTNRIQYLDSWGATDVTFIQTAGILDPAVVNASGVTSEIADLVLYNNSNTVNYAMGAGATLAMQISGTNEFVEGAGGYDQISVDNILTANGTLRVTFIDGFVAAEGDSFDLLDAASFDGAFTTVDLPALPEGRTWNTNKLLLNGILTVDSDAPSTASAAIISIKPVSNAVLALVVSSDNPAICYPKAALELTTNTVWSSVGHSTNGLVPFNVTNLSYSTVSGTNFLIYVEADQSKKFFKIGAE